MRTKKGFTLVEVGIVLFIVGILITIFLPQFTSGTKDTARGIGIKTLADKVSNSWRALTQECNVAMNDVTSLPNTALDKNINIIASGKSYIKPAYYTCYDNSNIALMSDSLGQNSASQHVNYLFGLYDIRITSSADSAYTFTVSVANVPSAYISAILAKFPVAVTFTPGVTAFINGQPIQWQFTGGDTYSLKFMYK